LHSCRAMSRRADAAIELWISALLGGGK